MRCESCLHPFSFVSLRKCALKRHKISLDFVCGESWSKLADVPPFYTLPQCVKVSFQKVHWAIKCEQEAAALPNPAGPKKVRQLFFFACYQLTIHDAVISYMVRPCNDTSNSMHSGIFGGRSLNHTAFFQCCLEKCKFWAMKQLALFQSVLLQAFTLVKIRVARSEGFEEKC